eukprot:CAMPEP_0116898858 /NCGR_PEP_ID=MMETSP0467-20121206/7524_1 /TAXON_ID=283647 /ORGANISM="Mesodinium pulex, Strain SPMC105" /LENGTH=124 /DNA_ID=CAMNT_0004571293 /DNA_START=34 /DNA_END=408 /DNA_ORIENTATION=+
MSLSVITRRVATSSRGVFVKAFSSKPEVVNEGTLLKTLEIFNDPVRVSMPAVFEAPHEIMFCPKVPDGPTLENSKPEDFVLAKVPKVEDTLEWLLTSPCPLHQFDEPPIIVEIEHLRNLTPMDV